MGTPGSIGRQIEEVEGFAVRFADEPGSRRRVPDYPYERAAKGTWSVSEYRRKRLDVTYPDDYIEVLRPDGSPAHGRTLLDNLRGSYVEADDLEIDDERDALEPEALVSSAIESPTRTATEPAARRSGKKEQAPRRLEATLWEAADKLRGNLEASEYKHVVLGLVFLKYVSDAFETRRAELEATLGDPGSPDYIPNEQRRATFLESRDEYTSANVFWVPPDARWQTIVDAAKLPTIGTIIDKAMDAIELDNPSLKGVLPKSYARQEIDKRRLGELIDVFNKNLGFNDVDHGADDVLGRIYEYFLGQFASSEGKRGGEYYTPRCVVRLLVEMVEPFKGRVYDPCCGSGGMFVQSAEFVAAHNGQRTDIAVYGQEFVAATWRLAKMNLALRGIDANLADGPDDTFSRDRHRDMKFDFILANPPFNVSDWGGEHLREDVRWKYGTPPAGNANFAWVQHMIHHLAPSGVAGFVLANGSMTSNTSGEGEVRKNIVEADLVDCMVALPGQLFYTTQIPVCLWFLAKNKADGGKRDRRSEILFIDARNMGSMISRVQRELTAEDIAMIADTYHAWRGEAGEYADVPGFCKSAAVEEVRTHGHVLTPGRYVGAAEVEDDGEPFAERMTRLVATLREQRAEAVRLDAKIEVALKELGYG